LSELRAPQPERLKGQLLERRVVVLERDTIHRYSTERILRREDYWVFVTHDATAAVRVAAVSAVDLLLVDLELDVLSPEPQAAHRRGHAAFDDALASLGVGYAVLRPVLLDPQAHFPIVTLRHEPQSEESCRFVVVGLLPRDASARRLVQGLVEVFDEGEFPALDGPAPARGGQSEPLAHPFEKTPVPLRSALVVDPDVAARRSLVKSLQHHDFTVYEAASGEDALRVAVARHPWLVVTEAQLADESGLEFCRRMRGHSLLRRTPIVFLSALDDCDRRHQALQAGADDYLAKPTPSRELLIRLELVLRRFTADIPGEAPGAGLRGTVELMGAPAVLQICHLNQLSGVLVARRGSQSLRIGFRRGQIFSATGGDQRGADVVYDFIAWSTGEFEFDRSARVDGLPMSDDFNGLLLEGCRRLDERRRGHTDTLLA